MALTSSTLRSLVEKKHEEDVDESMEVIISSLPQENGWWLETMYKYQGYWFDKPLLKGLLIAQKTFIAQPHNLILATLPKSGTTWFASLLFTLINRTQFNFTSHPLLTSSPHDCVPGIEFHASKNPTNPNLNDKYSLLASHIPYQLLPESIKTSSFCPIVYVYRDPKDVFISLWHFANKLRPKCLPNLRLEQGFELFCQGASPFGSYWDHVLGYWKAKQERPNKVFFVRYEDMQSDPIVILNKLAKFVGYPFSIEEEKSGMVDKIVEFCSFESLTSFQVNRVEVERKSLDGANVANNVFFRKGTMGDYKNYLTDDMIKTVNEITKIKFEGLGL